MIGTKLYKNGLDLEQYQELATWCNYNNAQIIDNGDYYETVKITVYEPTIEEIKVDTLLNIKQRLTSTDYKQAKFIDGELTDTEYEPIKSERASLRKLYNEIEVAKTIEELNVLIAGGEYCCETLNEDGTCPTEGCVHNDLMDFDEVAEGD